VEDQVVAVPVELRVVVDRIVSVVERVVDGSVNVMGKVVLVVYDIVNVLVAFVVVVVSVVLDCVIDVVRVVCVVEVWILVDVEVTVIRGRIPIVTGSSGSVVIVMVVV